MNHPIAKGRTRAATAQVHPVRDATASAKPVLHERIEHRWAAELATPSPAANRDSKESHVRGINPRGERARL